MKKAACGGLLRSTGKPAIFHDLVRLTLAEFADFGQWFLWRAHHQMGVRNAGVSFLDALAEDTGDALRLARAG